MRIGELARRTGVSPELLRAWEQRYGLLQPSRSPSGYRLYAAVDEERVRQMTRRLAAGLSAAEAARQTLTTAEAPPEDSSAVPLPVVGHLAEQLQGALDAFDTGEAHGVLDRLLGAVSVETLLAEVIIPYLRDLGDRWATGRATVAQEHFASNLLRGRLLGLARDWGTGDGHRALLACPPGEPHDLGLVMFGLLIAGRGWRVTFLGADTPFDTLQAGIHTIQPSLVVIATTRPDLVGENAEELAAVAGLVRTTLAGVAIDEAVAPPGVEVLAGDIVEAAQHLALPTGH